MRRAAKRDLTEQSIVDALLLTGWSVLRVNVADGPDLFVSKADRGTVAVECKTGTRKLRPGQVRFRERWQGEYVVLRTVDDTLKFHRGRLEDALALGRTSLNAVGQDR